MYYNTCMIGFNLLHELKVAKSEDQRDEAIAKAIEQVEAKQIDICLLATKEDLSLLRKDISVFREDLKDLEIRLMKQIQINTWVIIGAMGFFSALSKLLFKV